MYIMKFREWYWNLKSEICDLLKMKSYVSKKIKMSSAFAFALFCFDGEVDAKQELQSMNIPNQNCCDVCRNVCNCEECLLIEAMDSCRTRGAWPRQNKRCVTETVNRRVRAKSMQTRGEVLPTQNCFQATRFWYSKRKEIRSQLGSTRTRTQSWANMVTAWLCSPKKEFSILATPQITRNYYRTVIHQVHRRDQLNSKV